MNMLLTTFSKSSRRRKSHQARRFDFKSFMVLTIEELQILCRKNILSSVSSFGRRGETPDMKRPTNTFWRRRKQTTWCRRVEFFDLISRVVLWRVWITVRRGSRDVYIRVVAIRIGDMRISGVYFRTQMERGTISLLDRRFRQNTSHETTSSTFETFPASHRSSAYIILICRYRASGSPFDDRSGGPQNKCSGITSL
jgi:hypothetical protein